ncbi:MAG TPA: ATP-binding cassette domain-containing protein [Asanoa sp.]|uniref:ATP-binding cassette domain-containing protein n=1 Tax=Kribbella sp. TaxID=1871183 RepID=UPI002B9A7695|nr:ATP-binding cassette domain-containing protein [Kribbella sp.]HET6292879.1 ATP-binding cassette domain-containing protein [Kribbella sp.]HTF07536.1 ATP-binding cassette domain-containing protein [Asanoa sp.]
MTLRLNNCTYTYRPWRPPVLRDFDYELPDGLTVLLGPNGAGKSTLLRLAASVTRPRRGTVDLDGLPAGTGGYRRAVAWMPQTVVPMTGLTARDYVAYVGWLKGMNRRDAWDRAERALARVELTARAGTRTSELSGGQLRRVGVAAALVHDARVLLLDEPTAGMDPRQRRIFRDLLAEVTGDVRVLLSTHDVADLAEEADHVTVLSQGRIVHSGSTDSFLAHTPSDVSSGRAAEAAYSALLEGTGAVSG